jgi:hypothetical protein
MDFPSKLLQEIVPAVVTGIENLFGNRPGAEKKNTAISFVQTALSMASAIESREIVDETGFKALEHGDRRSCEVFKCLGVGKETISHREFSRQRSAIRETISRVRVRASHRCEFPIRLPRSSSPASSLPGP